MLALTAKVTAPSILLPDKLPVVSCNVIWEDPETTPGVNVNEIVSGVAWSVVKDPPPIIPLEADRVIVASFTVATEPVIWKSGYIPLTVISCPINVTVWSGKVFVNTVPLKIRPEPEAL